MNINTELVIVGPVEARAMIVAHEKSGQRQRPLRQGNVLRFAADMSTGMWMMTGEPIIIGSNDAVLDGQHRLRAVIESQATVQMMVVRGVSPDTFKAMNSGRSRSSSDVLNLAGYANTTSTAALAASVMLAGSVGLDNYRTWTRCGPSARAIMEFVSKNEWISEFVSAGGRCKGFRIAKPIGLLGVLTRVRHDDTPHERYVRFIDLLVSGESLPARSPILAFRRRLLSALGVNGGTSRTRSHIDEPAKLGMTMKVWNWWMRDVEVSVVSFRGGRKDDGGERIQSPIHPDEVAQAWSSDRVLALREALGWSRSTLAKHVGVGNTLVQLWETDQSAVHADGERRLNELHASMNGAHSHAASAVHTAARRKIYEIESTANGSEPKAAVSCLCDHDKADHDRGGCQMNMCGCGKFRARKDGP